MAVAHSVNSNGGSGATTNGVINVASFNNTLTATQNTIVPGASDTTCIIFIQYAGAAVTTGWTIKAGTLTASLIASSSFSETAGGTQSILAFEVKSPTAGAQNITGGNSGAGFAGGVAGYLTAITFTGSDTVNPSVAFGQSNSTAVATATTGASGSSIPSTDMVAAWFTDSATVFGAAVGNYGTTGGTSLTFVDQNNGATSGNSGQTYASGNNAAVTMTAALSTNDGYNALGIWVKVPAAAGQVPYSQYNNQPQLASILAQKRKSFVGWNVNPDHRWRKQKGLLVPNRTLIKKAA